MPSPNHSALSRFLDRLLSRSRLGEKERLAILGLRSRVNQVGAHRDIVTPGQTVGHACLVGRGLAGRFDQMSDGKRQITAFYVPGDMCDLHSVVCPTAQWGITALAATTVLFVPHSDLRELATTYPAIALAFWREATVDASVLAKWVGNVGRRDAVGRLAHLLCETGLRMEKAGLGTRTNFLFDITQEQLADAIGLTPVHTNRTMQALRHEGAIHTIGRTVHVDGWERLTAIADFEPGYLLFELPKDADGKSGNGRSAFFGSPRHPS